MRNRTDPWVEFLLQCVLLQCELLIDFKLLDIDIVVTETQ